MIGPNPLTTCNCPSCNFIALFVRHHLTEADVILSGPCADHMNGRFRTGFVIASTQCLAINGNHLASRDFVQQSNPAEQTLFKFRRSQRTENSVEPIMGRNTLRHIQKCAKSVLLRADKLCDGHEVIAAPQITAVNAMTTMSIRG